MVQNINSKNISTIENIWLIFHLRWEQRRLRTLEELRTEPGLQPRPPSRRQSRRSDSTDPAIWNMQLCISGLSDGFTDLDITTTSLIKQTSKYTLYDT